MSKRRRRKQRYKRMMKPKTIGHVSLSARRRHVLLYNGVMKPWDAPPLEFFYEIDKNDPSSMRMIVVTPLDDYGYMTIGLNTGYVDAVCLGDHATQAVIAGELDPVDAFWMTVFSAYDVPNTARVRDEVLKEAREKGELVERHCSDGAADFYVVKKDRLSALRAHIDISGALPPPTLTISWNNINWDDIVAGGLRVVVTDPTPTTEQAQTTVVLR